MARRKRKSSGFRGRAARTLGGKWAQMFKRAAEGVVIGQGGEIVVVRAAQLAGQPQLAGFGKFGGLLAAYNSAGIEGAGAYALSSGVIQTLQGGSGTGSMFDY